MKDRRYGASRDVPVAEFLYRHEAEFAAGFLRSAGIPFRLQVDDAGGADAGVTIARPAVLWVRVEDVEEAREILDLDGPASGSAVRSAEGGGAADGLPGRAELPPRIEPPRPAVAPREERDARRGAGGIRHSTGAPPGTTARGGLEPLCRAERLVAGFLALALFGLASAGGDGAVPWVGLWEGAALLLALALGLSAASGRTIGALKALLRAVSGVAR